MTVRVSAFVVTYERSQLLRACLRRARWVDELIVVDKSSNDDGATAMVARVIADRYVVVPWTPTADDTREYAQSLCTGDWIVRLDDDELLSPGAGDLLRPLLAGEPVDVFYLPIRHHVLGRCDPRIKVEFRPSVYRRGHATYAPFVHTDPEVRGRTAVLGGGDIFIEHLSHPTVFSWLEKANRYTMLSVAQQPHRKIVQPSLSGMALELLTNRIESLNQLEHVDPYVEALALLSAVYDVVEGLKVWEATQPDGHAAFAAICDAVERET